MPRRAALPQTGNTTSTSSHSGSGDGGRTSQTPHAVPSQVLHRHQQYPLSSDTGRSATSKSPHDHAIFPPTSSSSSSISHALNMPQSQKHGLRDEPSQAESSVSRSGAESSANVSGKASTSNDVWLSPSQQPVTSEELDNFLASKHWKLAEVDMDESLEEMLSHDSSSWQPTPTASSSQQELLWTSFRDGASSATNTAGVGDMEWDAGDSRSPLLSEPSLSPSSFSATFPSTLTDADFIRALSDHPSAGTPSSQLLSLPEELSGSANLGSSSSSASSLASTAATASFASQSDPANQSDDMFSRPLSRRLYVSNTPTSQSSLRSVHDYQQQPGLPHLSPPQPSRQGSIRRTYTNSPSSVATSRSSGLHVAQHSMRPRAGTVASASSYPRSSLDHKSSLHSSSSSGTMGRIQESTPTSFRPVGAAGAISASLSAELAGLGLDVSDFYPNASFASSSHDVTMGDVIGSEMHRTDSSMTSTTNQMRRLHDQGDGSFLSQATSSLDSSGLDDSLLSIGSNNQSSTRWIHGKDTPPSSPAPSFGSQIRPSPRTDQRSSGLSQQPSSLPYSRPDEFGAKRVAQHIPQQQRTAAAADWPRTWPRAMAQHEVSSGSNTSSPMHHSRSDNAVNSALSAPKESTARHRPTSSSSSQSLQDRRQQRSARGLSGGALLEPTQHSGVGRRSNDSLQSDIGPSRSNKASAEVIEKRRWKRMSASFLSDYDARQRYQEEQSQYDQVSDALDTLRRFLRQRESGAVATSPSASQSSLLAPSMGGAYAPTLSSPSSTHSPPQRTLRHPPSGPLPPRGSIYTSPSDHSPLTTQHHQGPSVEEERIAALEDLAKRVRQMKDDNQRILDDD